MTSWRLLASPPATGVHNMAVDEMLVSRAAETGDSVFRTYEWSRPTVSFGRHQLAAGVYDRTRIRSRDFDVVRRITGGRALLHHREITYSVTGPLNGRSPRDLYEETNLLLVTALRSIGVDASIATSARALSPGPMPCFNAPSTGEIMVAGRKLVGSAFWRGQGSYLQHGSILIEDDQSALAELTSVALPATPPPATLSSILGRVPARSEITEAIRHALSFDGNVQDFPAESLDSTRLESVANRYRDESWTWRK